MKSISSFGERSFLKDKRGVFGLTSVQQFFAIILGVALLAYVIVVIMGTLESTDILSATTLTTTVTNESAFANFSGDPVNAGGAAGFRNPVIVIAYNASTGIVITNNLTLGADGVLRNATPLVYRLVNLTYTYGQNSVSQNQTSLVLSNVSTGITSFFSAINPVYAILAILVIILVLVVLVRVVSGGNTGRREIEPQL